MHSLPFLNRKKEERKLDFPFLVLVFIRKEKNKSVKKELRKRRIDREGRKGHNACQIERLDQWLNGAARGSTRKPIDCQFN